MDEHVRIAAILRIAYSGLGLVASAIIFLVFEGLAVLAAVAEPSSAHESVPLLTALGIWIAVLVGILGVPGVIVGWGMLRFRPWARILGIVFAARHLLALGAAEPPDGRAVRGPIAPPRF